VILHRGAAAVAGPGMDCRVDSFSTPEMTAEQAAFLEFATREMADLLTRWQQYQAGSG
jgi:hypothetical protein